MYPQSLNELHYCNLIWELHRMNHCYCKKCHDNFNIWTVNDMRYVILIGFFTAKKSKSHIRMQLNLTISYDDLIEIAPINLKILISMFSCLISWSLRHFSGLEFVCKKGCKFTWHMGSLNISSQDHNIQVQCLF